MNIKLITRLILVLLVMTNQQILSAQSVNFQQLYFNNDGEFRKIQDLFTYDGFITPGSSSSIGTGSIIIGSNVYGSDDVGYIIQTGLNGNIQWARTFPEFKPLKGVELFGGEIAVFGKYHDQQILMVLDQTGFNSWTKRLENITWYSDLERTSNGDILLVSAHYDHITVMEFSPSGNLNQHRSFRLIWNPGNIGSYAVTDVKRSGDDYYITGYSFNFSFSWIARLTGSYDIVWARRYENNAEVPHFYEIEIAQDYLYVVGENTRKTGMVVNDYTLELAKLEAGNGHGVVSFQLDHVDALVDQSIEVVGDQLFVSANYGVNLIAMRFDNWYNLQYQINYTDPLNLVGSKMSFITDPQGTPGFFFGAVTNLYNSFTLIKTPFDLHHCYEDNEFEILASVLMRNEEDIPWMEIAEEIPNEFTELTPEDNFLDSLLCQNIEERLEEPSGFNLSPNPAGFHSLLTLDEPAKGVTQLNIYDFSGNLVHTHELQPGETEWLIEGLPKGLYVVKKLTDNTSTEKLLRVE